MFPRYVIGIDPGPLVGVVRLRLDGPGAQAEQVPPADLQALLERWHAAVLIRTISVEWFVVGPRAARSATPSGGAAARAVVSRVCDWAETSDLPVVLRSAAEVKPWATDARLEAAGLLEATKGKRHARDAARHALYTAVRSHGLPDPLSSKAGYRASVR